MRYVTVPHPTVLAQSNAYLFDLLAQGFESMCMVPLQLLHSAVTDFGLVNGVAIFESFRGLGEASLDPFISAVEFLRSKPGCCA